MNQTVISHGDSSEIPSFRARKFRTYRFEKRSSSRSLLCDVYMPEYYPGDDSPCCSFVVELGDPLSKALLPSRIRVNSRPDFPLTFVLDELSYFSSTLRQMYQL